MINLVFIVMSDLPPMPSKEAKEELIPVVGKLLLIVLHDRRIIDEEPSDDNLTHVVLKNNPSDALLLINILDERNKRFYTRPRTDDGASIGFMTFGVVIKPEQNDPPDQVRYNKIGTLKFLENKFYGIDTDKTYSRSTTMATIVNNDPRMQYVLSYPTETDLARFCGQVATLDSPDGLNNWLASVSELSYLNQDELQRLQAAAASVSEA